MMTKEDVLRLLRKMVAEAGGQKAFAKANGIEQSIISEVLHGHRDPPPRLLDKMGINREWMYHKG